MNGMHEARKNEFLMAYQRFAHTRENKGVHVENRQVFIVLKMKKLYLCLSSHDHAKFSHECVKLIWEVVEIVCLWTISHDHVKISHDYVKVILNTIIK